MFFYFAQCLPILKYQTFRSLMAVFSAFFISWLFGQKFIDLIGKVQKNGQPIRNDGPKSHTIDKAGTPTMGGLLILLSVTISTLLFAKLHLSFIWVLLSVMWGFGLIGLLDDVKKIRKNDNYQGLSVRSKFVLQFLIAILTGIFVFYAVNGSIFFPLFKNFVITLPLWLYVIWSSLVVVGSSNAVNLTDGLDGLAIFPVMMACLSLGIIAFVSGHAGLSHYLLIPYIPKVGEIIVFLGAWVGASLGFLWYNAPPARIFMGDIGSLAAGGILGTVALLIKHEIVWGIIGAIFVVEALSVIIQVFYFKKTRKRVFLMAPLHHHFEHKGFKEPTIVIRFWIISVLLALIGLATLKLR